MNKTPETVLVWENVTSNGGGGHPTLRKDQKAKHTSAPVRGHVYSRSKSVGLFKLEVTV